MIQYALNPKKAAALVLLLVGMLCWAPLGTLAVTKNDGDMAYKRGNYQQAIADYNSLLRQGKSAEVYYNLGNAYYRVDSIAMAILAYERAAQLAPGDDDIRFNLQYARSRTIDKITPESEVVFATWYRSVVNLMGADSWAVVGVCSIVLALLLMLVYLFVPQLALRKVGFFGGTLFLILFAASTLFAWSQKKTALESRGAIVMSPSVSVKKTPVQSSEDAFILHEGSRVDITDSSLRGWIGIRLSDGREGWLPTRHIEMI